MNNDRFKFRVWDTLEKSHRCGYLFSSDGRLFEWGNFESVETANKDRFIKEQCTGLKDKNGKLIYEGDVVRFQNGFGGQIVWCDGWWIYDRIRLSPLTKHIDGIEIVRNIHEEGTEGESKVQ